MTITANGEMGNAVEKLPIYLEGKPLSIAFNAKYLLDVLRVIKDEEILFYQRTVSLRGKAIGRRSIPLFGAACARIKTKLSFPIWERELLVLYKQIC